MLGLLKNLAAQKLKEKMLTNSLGADATQAATEEGAFDLGKIIVLLERDTGGSILNKSKGLF